MEATDWQLLQRFADDRSQAAFRELTRRYTNLVYGVCQRELSDPGLAEDAAQAVFLLLARKAPTLRPARHEATLSSWLFQTALLTARNVRRSEQRRAAREQEAAQMQADSSHAPEGWADIEPLLNDALHALPPGQRTLILERFFEDRPLAEIGAGLSVSEDATRMRVNRALERLRRFFAARNIALSAAALAALLPHAVHPAPAHAADLLGRLPLPTDGGSSAPTHAQAIAQGAIHTMNIHRLRLQLGTAALVAVFILGTAGAVRVTSERKAQAVQQQKVQAVQAPQQSSTQALAIMDQMYATYAAMKSFNCDVTSREDPLGTAQDGDYEIERPNKIRFRRATLLGVEDSGKEQAVSDGKNLYITHTEAGGVSGSRLSDRYAKIALEPSVDPSLLYTFGGLASWGTEPLAGMPAVALGGDKNNNVSLTSTDYSLGQPVTMSPPMINEHDVPNAVADVVIVTKHILYGTYKAGKIDAKTGKDVPSTITYYIGQRDHLLYKMTASYPVSSTGVDTRTETYADQDINPKLPASDFVFTPPPGSHEVSDATNLVPGSIK